MRFAVTAFGLVMLAAQFASPARTQAQQYGTPYYGAQNYGAPYYGGNGYGAAPYRQVQAVQNQAVPNPMLLPNQPALTQPIPNQQIPSQPVPNQLRPTQPVPNQQAPAQPVPNQPAPQPIPDPVPQDPALSTMPDLDAPLPPSFSSPRGIGAVAGAFSAAPNMVGDNFGISTSAVGLTATVRAPMSSATIITGAPGNLNSVLSFDANPVSGADTVSVGPGALQFGQVVFQVAEPALGSIIEGPDAECFRYVGGTATSDDPTGFSDPWDLELVYQCDAISIRTAGSNVGRIKTAEDVSPIPRDRHFFNYSYFSEVPLTGNGISVNRFTLGMEEAFFDENMSVEFRMPMAVTLDSTYSLNDPDISEWEFGDLYLASKYLFSQSCNHYLSVGLAVSVPTAKDSKIFLNDSLLTRIDNTSVRLAPYLGGLVFNDIFFAQGFFQVDVDVSGDDVMTPDPSSPGDMVKSGNFRDPTLLYLDLQVGAWLLRKTRPTERDWLTGLASIFELHYNRNLDSLDSVNLTTPVGVSGITRTLSIGDSDADIDVLNALAGVAFDFGGRSLVSVTYGVPFTGGKQFDGEFRVTANCFR